jgi:D-alanyl-D-alanine carboxypeptidase/D-alanyl-D-alanine-endopeptidase (penicillin-binding protein 4)
MERMIASVKKAGVKNYSNIAVDETGWEGEAIPDGWIWQDIGNYYGAGAGGLNWRENQYDLLLGSGSAVGSAVTISGSKPKLHGIALVSQAEAAAKGSGDNAYIYFVPGTDTIVVRGTIPAGEEKFVISGAIPSPKRQLAATLAAGLAQQGILSKPANGNAVRKDIKVIHTETSPPLDSIIYWFNKKSINLYGEALVKTIGHRAAGSGATEKGVRVIKDFWKGKGIEEWELRIVDGSGLSPLDRVTTHAMVEVLQYARAQPWFDGFYHALPEYNGMKLKSGTIRGVKAFSGYHKARDGKEYIIAFIVNNYNGSSSGLVQKMYTVLDVLK